MQSVSSWLKSLSLEQYSHVLADNDVDLDVLRILGDKDLQDLGVSFGHRKKLLKAIAELNGAEATQLAPGLAATSPTGGERRQLTVLFCDLVGSTALSSDLDPEDLRDVVRGYQKAVAEVIGRHEGYIAQYLGDGLLIYFGYPKPHEDDAARAVRAGLGVVAAICELSFPATRVPGPLQVRIGIHTGPVVIDEIGADDRRERLALGETPNVAARLQALAEPNAVMVSDATHRLLEGLFDFEARGSHQLKGVAGPVHTYRVRASRAVASRFEVSKHRGLAPLVGRQQELETLEANWSAARTGVRVVNIAGEAGIGKSRVVHEFAARISAEQALLLWGHCTSEGQRTPFLPFIELVRTSFRLDEGDGKIEEKLRRGLELLGLGQDDNLPYLLHLLGRAPDSARALDSEILGLRTRQALQALLKARCRLSPVVMIVEDLHWIDTASEEYLRWATEPERGLPLLIACTYRPGYRPAWAGRPNVIELRLEPLSRTSTIDLIRTRLGTAGLAPQIETLVAQKAEGNPLFAEELATYLQEMVGRRGAQPTVHDEVTLPVTLENLLMERVARLPDGPRTVLQAAAVVGRRFSLDLVTRVSRLNGAMTEWLHDLERQDFVYTEPGRDQFAFKHALVRDAVYQNLLKARREELHARVASALEVAHAERLEEVADTLADHYARTRHADKAVRYLALAGERSLALYSLDEAESRFRHALDLIRAVPGCADDTLLADVLLKIARVFYFRGDAKSFIGLGQEYLPRVEALGDKRRLSRFLFEAGYAHVFAARQDVGKPLLERALALGEEIGDEESIGYACLGLMWHYVFWAPPGPERRATVERLGNRALAVGRRLHDVWLMSKTLICLASDAGVWGRAGEAERLGRQLLQLSDETGDPRPKGMGLFYLAIISAYRDEFDSALEYAESAIRSSVSPVDRLFGRLGKATALAMRGDARESLELLEELREQTEAGEWRITGLFYAELPYGVALVYSGALADGVRQIDSAVERYAAWGQPFARCYGHLVLGQIYLTMAQGGPRPPLGVVLRNLGFLVCTAPFAARLARRHLEAAVQEFRRLDIPSSLAFALFHLGVLHETKRRTAEARACFDEGRAIAASVDASALCERIAAAQAKLR